MSADSRCVWRQQKSVSKLSWKWRCIVCGRIARATKGERPTKCKYRPPLT